MKTYEYKTIYNNECGLQDDDFRNQLESYLVKQNLKGALIFRNGNIGTTSYVGVIKYKNFQLDILPKLLKNSEPEGKNEEKDQEEADFEEDLNEETALSKQEEKELNNENRVNQITKNLIDMISFTEKLDIKITEYADINKCENPFLEVLIREYAVSLFECLKRLTPRNYVREEDNLNYLKGKLKFTENIRYNCANKAKFYCEYDEFSENNPLNRLFLFVSKCLFKISRSSENKKVLSFIMNYFCDLPFERTDKYKAEKIILTRNQKLFEHPFKLAKMFLQHISVDISRNSIENITLLWDMNKLFEKFVYQVLLRGCKNYEPQEQKDRKLLKNPDNNRKRGNTFVDIYMTKKDNEKDKKNVKIILDTKYKLQTLSDNADIYQICTYCLLHKTENSVLIYPKTNDSKIKESNIFFTSDINEYQLNRDEDVDDIFINRIYVDLTQKNIKDIVNHVDELEDILDTILKKHEIKNLINKYEISKDNKNISKEEKRTLIENILKGKIEEKRTLIENILKEKIEEKIKELLKTYTIKDNKKADKKATDEDRTKELLNEIMETIK